MRAGLVLSMLALLGFTGVAASQERPAWLRMAMAAEAVDPEALRKAADPNSEEQQKLVAATELAWLHRDAEATIVLRALADTAQETTFRLDALNQLAGLHMRAGNYVLAAAAARESQKLGASFSAGKSGQNDLLTAAEALKDTPAMTLSGKTRGSVPLRLAKDGIPRARVSVNGIDEEAILDTGASFSSISLSLAKKAGVRPLKATVRIAPGGGPEANAGIGVADELVIAETTFRNVVVLILPDKDMDVFGNVAKVGMVVGLPVFLKMGSIAMLPDKNDNLAFAFKPAKGQPGDKSNMRLTKLTLVLSVVLKRTEPVAVNLLLDTGANVTSFNARFAASFPELVANAPIVATKSAVIGEASLLRQARRLGELRFEVGGRGFAVAGANVYDDQRPAYHGVLGEDILRAGFTADFGTMIFELAPSSKVQVKREVQ